MKKSAIITASLVVWAFVSPVLAKSNIHKFTIVEANALSVSVSVGRAGDSPVTYKITDATTVKIDGLDASARDLKGGMVAVINLATDKTTVLSIYAEDPKKPSKRRH